MYKPSRQTYTEGVHMRTCGRLYVRARAPYVSVLVAVYVIRFGHLVQDALESTFRRQQHARRVCHRLQDVPWARARQPCPNVHMQRDVHPAARHHVPTTCHHVPAIHHQVLAAHHHVPATRHGYEYGYAYVYVYGYVYGMSMRMCSGMCMCMYISAHPEVQLPHKANRMTWRSADRC